MQSFFSMRMFILEFCSMLRVGAAVSGTTYVLCPGGSQGGPPRGSQGQQGTGGPSGLC